MSRFKPWTDAEIVKVCEMAAQGVSARIIGETIGRSDDAVWLLKRRVPGLTFNARPKSKKHDVPADFAEHAYQPIKVLRARYGVRHETITVWRAAVGVTPQMVRDHQAMVSGRIKRNIPEGFAEYQLGRSVEDVAKHFGMHRNTARRMFAELGIDRQQQYNDARAAMKRAKPVKAAAPRRPMASTFTQTGGVERPHIDITPAGQAAEFLRRFGPVVRCNEQGRYDPAGNRWRRGSSLLTADEIIQRAVRNGWQTGRLAA